MDNIYDKVSIELDIPKHVIKEAYQSYWKYIRETIQSLPLKEDLNEEDFNKYRTNFNIPSLGKLTCTYLKYKGVKKRFKFLKELNGNN